MWPGRKRHILWHEALGIIENTTYMHLCIMADMARCDYRQHMMSDVTANVLSQHTSHYNLWQMSKSLLTQMRECYRGVRHLTRPRVSWRDIIQTFRPKSLVLNTCLKQKYCNYKKKTNVKLNTFVEVSATIKSRAHFTLYDFITFIYRLLHGYILYKKTLNIYLNDNSQSLLSVL